MHKTKIKNLVEAKRYIEALHKSGKDFHFDDDPADIIEYATGLRSFTDEESAEISKRVDEMYAIDWGKFECPIGYLLHIREGK